MIQCNDRCKAARPLGIWAFWQWLPFGGLLFCTEVGGDRAVGVHTLLTMNTLLTIVWVIVKRVWAIVKIVPQCLIQTLGNYPFMIMRFLDTLEFLCPAAPLISCKASSHLPSLFPDDPFWILKRMLLQEASFHSYKSVWWNPDIWSPNAKPPVPLNNSMDSII